MFTFACKRISMEEIVRCGFGINKTEYKVLVVLLKNKSELTTMEIAHKLHKERTTIQKALKSLVDKKIIRRRQINLEAGGYLYVYFVDDINTIKSNLVSIIRNWENAVEKEIERW